MRVSRRKNSSTNQLPENDNGVSPGKVRTRAATIESDTATNASEEDVFARLVSDEIKRTQTSEVQTSFQALVDKQLKIRTRADGSVNLEKVWKGALKWASNDKNALLSKDDAQNLYSRTFTAAQLDSNTDSLDDSSVPAATMPRDTAFEKARVKLEKLVSGETETPARNLQELVTSSIFNSVSTEKTADLVTDTIEKIILSNENFQI